MPPRRRPTVSTMHTLTAPADLVIAHVDGIPVRLAGIEVDPTGLHVSYQGTRGDETRERDARHGRAMQAWAQQHATHGKDAAGHPPQMPGVPILEPVGATLGDDHGTTYRLTSGQVAGDGTEWEATWTYTPAPPPGVDLVRFRFTVNGEPTGKECQLHLD